MSSRSRLQTGLTLLAVLAACQPSSAELSTADTDAIKAVTESYRASAFAGDWDAWGKTLATDVVYSPPNMEPLKGRDAAVTWAKTFPKITNFTQEIVEVVGRGDLAYARGTYNYAVAMPDGSAASDQGDGTWIFRRQADGAWLATRLIWHSKLPLPAPPAPPAKKK
jgi:ketosteroid isomerase-like protein